MPMNEVSTVSDDPVTAPLQDPPGRRQDLRQATSRLRQYLGDLFAAMPEGQARWGLTTYTALAVLIAVWAALFYRTWATWGNLTIDSGHEMYVPAGLSTGKMLYRDIWFMY